MAAKSPRSLYRNIITTADAIKKLSAAALSVKVTSRLTPDVPSPSALPPPLPIRDSLIADGVPPRIAARLSDAFQKSAENLRRRMEGIYQSAWAKLLQSPRHETMMSLTDLQEQLRETHRILFFRKLDSWREEIRERALSALSTRNPAGANRTGEKGSNNGRRTFNHQYVRLLEIYFEKNPLPSKADKLHLAQASGMSYRQIHVWFQNRRSRSRRQKETGRGSLTSTYAAVSTGCRPERSECTSSLQVTPKDSVDGLLSCGPAYAFPTVYPPEISSENDPFPCRFGNFSNLAKPDWTRKPVSHRRKDEVLDTSSLCLAFANLKIDVSGQYSSQKEGDTTLASQGGAKTLQYDAISPCTIRPLRAPLRSLVRSARSNVVNHSEKPLSDPEALQNQLNGTQITAPRDCRTQSTSHRSRRSRKPETKQDATGSLARVHSDSDSISKCTKSSAGTKVVKELRKRCLSISKSSSSALGCVKGQGSSTVQTAEQSPEPRTTNPSPTPSIESLPSLSYSSNSSSASAYSQSPTTPFVILPDDRYSPSLNSCQPVRLRQSLVDEYPPPVFASEVSFDVFKGPLNYLFSMDLPSCPSYSESLDFLSPGLQSSPDFAPPSLTFDLPFLAP